MEKEQLLDWIAQDHLEEALEALKDIAVASGRSDIRREQVAVSGRLSNYKSRLHAGTDNPEDLVQERNRIRIALRDLTEHCFAPPAPAGALLKRQFIQWRWPLLILILALGALGIGMLPLREAYFEASLLTTDVQLRLAKDWDETMTFPVNRCDLIQLSEIRGAGWQEAMDADQDEALDVQLDSGLMQIAILYVPPQSVLSMQIRGENITLTLPSGGNGTVQAGNTTLSIMPDGTTRSTSESELLEWIAEPGGGLNFALPPGDTSFRWGRTAIKGVDFVQKVIETGEPKSAIRSGELRIAAKEPIALDEEFLDLAGLRDADIRILPQGQVFAIELKGFASEIRSGLQRTRSQKPTLLEHFYRDQKISFFSGVLVSLISLLWAIRGAIISQKD